MSSLHLTDAWELLKMTAQVDWVWIYINVTQKAISLLTAYMYMYGPWNLENQKFFLKVIGSSHIHIPFWKSQDLGRSGLVVFTQSFAALCNPQPSFRFNSIQFNSIHQPLTWFVDWECASWNSKRKLMTLNVPFVFHLVGRTLIRWPLSFTLKLASVRKKWLIFFYF